MAAAALQTQPIAISFMALIQVQKIGLTDIGPDMNNSCRQAKLKESDNWLVGIRVRVGDPEFDAMMDKGQKQPAFEVP
ncbi:hypothetical protein PAAG_04090 [Paracoccidioides lutzii Pb01]|uniref:Uncharacterized protein n=1 Tax=Paracoccidioides lutzii (strain ATCC MYA-826 / Pb01) TaxID=502779 RepID=C1GZZ6_PARBA|nr:hypothetical protein PAAG_04090 [Paracoccidioides lutzii Pb01]EEH33037.2 hypothetical protein PAAG_04090 [Paracoccidioides lutzii Pb01]